MEPPKKRGIHKIPQNDVEVQNICACMICRLLHSAAHRSEIGGIKPPAS
jgi:hypothetical protein